MLLERDTWILTLTLKLNAEVIQRAKNYAASQHRSLSGIVEAYLKSLVNQAGPEKDTDEIVISPYVKSMATGVKIPSDIDAKAVHIDHRKAKEI